MSNSSFEEIFQKEGQLIYSNVGDSMQPLIRQGGDLLVIGLPEGRLKNMTFLYIGGTTAGMCCIESLKCALTIT